MIKNESQNAWDGKYRIDDTMFDKYSFFEIRKRINKGETKHGEFKITLEKIIRDLQKIIPILPVEFYNIKINDSENIFLQIYDSSRHDKKNINYYIGAYKDKISQIHEFIDDKDLVIFHYFDRNMSWRLDPKMRKRERYLEYLFSYWQALRVRIEQKILPNFREVLVDLKKDDMLARLKPEQSQKPVETTSGNKLPYTKPPELEIAILTKKDQQALINICNGVKIDENMELIIAGRLKEALMDSGNWKLGSKKFGFEAINYSRIAKTFFFKACYDTAKTYTPKAINILLSDKEKQDILSSVGK